MRIVGVDPGGAGALALLTPDGLWVEDMPVFMVRRGRTDKPELDVHGLLDILGGWRPIDAVYFEQVGGMTGEAASSAFNFGRVAGAAEAVCKIAGIPFHFVTPPVWKKAIGLKGGKDDSRAKATALWPAHAGLFRRVKDDGRAEAALIAEWGRRQSAVVRVDGEDLFA